MKEHWVENPIVVWIANSDTQRTVRDAAEKLGRSMLLNSPKKSEAFAIGAWLLRFAVYYDHRVPPPLDAKLGLEAACAIVAEIKTQLEREAA